MNSQTIKDIIEISMAKIKETINSEAIIGDPIKIAEGAVVIPISKVSFGFASGGSDLPTKSSKELFGGGAGAGVSIKPVAFISFSNGEIKLLRLEENETAAAAVLGKVPETIEKLQTMFKSKSVGESDDE